MFCVDWRPGGDFSFGIKWDSLSSIDGGSLSLEGVNSFYI